MSETRDNTVSGISLALFFAFLVTLQMASRSVPFIFAACKLFVLLLFVSSHNGDVSPAAIDISMLLLTFMLATSITWLLFMSDAQGTTEKPGRLGAIALIVLLSLPLYHGLHSVEVAYLGEPVAEPLIGEQFSVAQEGAEECPGFTINDLRVESDWAKLHSGTPVQRRKTLNKFAETYHPTNCGSCQRVCLETFAYALSKAT